jgi:hypothetical protein
MSDELRQIKDIAQRYTPEEIEGCITQQVETGKNICLTDDRSEKIISELSKAGVIKDLMGQGLGLSDALRELARRMRLLQSGFKGLTTDK